MQASFSKEPVQNTQYCCLQVAFLSLSHIIKVVVLCLGEYSGHLIPGYHYN